MIKAVLAGPYPYIGQEITGGASAVVFNLYQGFRKYGDKVSIKVLSGTPEAKQDYETYDDIVYIKKPKKAIGSTFLSRYPFRVKTQIQRMDFDVINAHSLDFAYYAITQKKVDKLVFTLHGVTWEEKKYLPKWSQIGWDILYVKRLKRVLNELKYLVAINPYVREVVNGKTNATIFDIPNPVPEEFFKIPTDMTEENRMFYIGVIGKRKNLFTLIKALPYVRKEVKDFKLVIAGKVRDKTYFQQIQNHITKHGLSENVEFLGTISEERKYEEFSKMSFLILPSFQETAPMVISEAFAAGKPVIASNVGGAQYMTGDNERGLLIDPFNEMDIAEKILYFLENPDEVKKMGRKAKRYAEMEHSLKNVIKRYEVAYEEISNQT
ncbi:glycosyltransferase family 4 protein [Thermococcus argininiproducens]|uniref:Glycosyltransferase family 4 protein n=1 Tax=Thermococcus argininiproducens TaxID=2866384 RepID=A0A9E7MAE7_9EURY|nr:glycosyltransferase family 4 protein [Thermococcus argininiproducens]USH00422.1 glycosyltransferase family 4 protein [Thermococcus argininiproducens]